jgi:hypothetical protein
MGVSGEMGGLLRAATYGRGWRDGVSGEMGGCSVPPLYGRGWRDGVSGEMLLRAATVWDCHHAETIEGGATRNS